MSTEHSPLPWKWTPCETEDGEPVSGAQLVRCDGKPVWSVDCGDYMGLSDADAEFIVRACNAFEDLASAMRLLVGYLRKHERWPVTSEHSIYLEVAERALRQAEGREAVTR